MSYKKLLAVLPCAALWAAMPSKADAQPQQQQPPPQHQPQQQQGMVVVRDAQSGQLRAPTPAELRALAPSPAPARMGAAAQPALVTHPGGSRHVRLGERGLVYSVATRGADGKLSGQCVHGEAAAEQALRAGTSAATSATASTSIGAAAHHEGHHHD